MSGYRTRGRERERKTTNEYECDQEKTVHFILFLWFVFVHATFVLSSVLAAAAAAVAVVAHFDSGLSFTIVYYTFSRVHVIKQMLAR